MELHYAVLSEKHTLGKDTKDKNLLRDLYISSGWQGSTLKASLRDIVNKEALLVIRTDNLVILDFDTNESFNEAIAFNDTLKEHLQCNFIIKSTRKGGHFYYALPNKYKDDPDGLSQLLPQGHTKQSIVDILTGVGHNAIAPTSSDHGKIILTGIPEVLNDYNIAINTFTALVVNKNLPAITRNIVASIDSDYSDDNEHFLNLYITDKVLQKEFNKFYNIPDPMPAGSSNSHYLRLSTRLGRDETVDVDLYLRVMQKFNNFFKRKSPAELKAEITNRMENNINGLWRYTEGKKKQTLTLTSKLDSTPVKIYYNLLAGYIVHNKRLDGKHVLYLLKDRTKYKELVEKLVAEKKFLEKNDTIAAVDIINDYTRPFGYDPETRIFNKACANEYLSAFQGSRPEHYEAPVDLIKMLQYMWEDEFDYMLAMTKYRYETFEFSPVITYLNGVEGSGKDITVKILTAGFATPPQQLTYELVKDIHSSWQTDDNANISEIGSWKSYERDDLLGKLKSISGSNGVVTYRGMYMDAQVVKTRVKIWITSNEWQRLHTDSTVQRRIHVVYMPNPLLTSSGGRYSTAELERLLSDSSIINFYHWLGNEYQVAPDLRVNERTNSLNSSHYNSAMCRSKSTSYAIYLENIELPSDRITPLIASGDYNSFVKSLEIIQMKIDDVDYKYSRKDGMLCVSVSSIKDVFRNAKGYNKIYDVIDRLSNNLGRSKLLKFSKASPERYITLTEAPAYLEDIETIPNGVDLAG